MSLRTLPGALTLTAILLATSVFNGVLSGSATAGEDLAVSFDKGLRMKSADGDFAFKMGGRIFFDWVYFSEDDDYLSTMNPIEDGNEFRTTRVYTSGTLYNNVEFKGQYDFASGKVKFKDVYVGLKKIPGTGIGLRAGHFKQPFGLAENTSPSTSCSWSALRRPASRRVANLA